MRYRGNDIWADERTNEQQDGLRHDAFAKHCQLAKIQSNKDVLTYPV